jgi:hypothetical protein
MKRALQVWPLLLFCAGCSAGEPAAVFEPQLARSNILAVLPSGWSIIPQSEVQGSKTRAYFDDPRIEAFILLGTHSNCLTWTDKQGLIHRKFLAKECLYIWLLPADCTPTFPPPWKESPPLPERVYSSRGINVYGLVFQHIADTNRFQTILDKEVGGEKFWWQSGDISWRDWRRDISASLKDMKMLPTKPLQATAATSSN